MRKFKFQDEEIEVLGEACNAWIVRTPGRKFPAMVIQGDTLKSLYSLVRRQCDLLKDTPEEEAYDLALQLEDDLADRLALYEDTLAEYGFSLPYAGSVKKTRLDQD